MDIDADEPQQVSLLSYFDVAPHTFAWRGSRPQEVEARRAKLNDLLIFDVLLSSGGIAQPDTLYPPIDVAALERLLSAIESSHYDALKKDCLVYFLLKWHQDGREERFQDERCIPPQFTALADAYWHLDTGINVPRAVSILSDARLNRDYASKILQAISLSPNSSSLILKYIRTAKPLLTEPDDIDAYAAALAESSLLEAWQFQRTFAEKDEIRARLVRNILDWCVSPTPRPGPLAQLLAFPFTPYELSLLHSHALSPSTTHPTKDPITPSALAILQELACVRLIQNGQYAEAIKMDRQFSSSSPTATSPSTKTQTQARNKMMQGLYETLPLAERALLDVDLEILAQGKTSSLSASSSAATTLSGSGSGEGLSTAEDLSMSWEDVRAPQPPKVNGNAMLTSASSRDLHTSAGSLSERSGGPRFGGPIVNPSSLKSAGPSLFPNSLSSSTSKAPAFLTNGNSIGSTSALTSSHKGRTSFPLSTTATTLTTSASRPRTSFGTSFGQIQPQNSSSTGLRFPPALPSQQKFPQLPATSASFNSAGSVPNAFYQPSGKVNGVKRPFGFNDGPPPPVPHVEENADYDVSMDRDDEHERRDGGEQVDEGPTELEYSVFSNGGRSVGETGEQRETNVPVQVKGKAQMPPGAFLSDEEEENEKSEEPSPPRRRRLDGPTKGSRTSTGVTKAKTATTAKPRTRTKNLKEQDLGRSLPGSLMDEEEDYQTSDAEGDRDAEEDDHVAPLRAPTSSKRPSRKGRTSVSMSEVADDGEGGMQTRRRSSRLSTASSAPAILDDASPSKKSAGKAKKATSGARKKR